MSKEIRQIIAGGAWRWCTVVVTEPKQEITVMISSVPAFALHGDRRRIDPLVFPPWHGEDFVTADQIRSWQHGSGFLIDPLWTNDTIYNAIEELVGNIRHSRERERRQDAEKVAREGAEQLVEARVRELVRAIYMQVGRRDGDDMPSDFDPVQVDDDDLPF